MHHLSRPRVREEFKPVLAFVRENLQPDDVVYVFYCAEPAFRYYADAYGFDLGKGLIISPEPANEYVKEVGFFRRSARSRTPRVAGFPDDGSWVLGVSEEFFKCRAGIEQLLGKERVWFVPSHALVYPLAER